MNLSQRLRWIWKGETPEAQRARRILKLALLLALFIGLFWIIPIRDVIYALLNADPLFLVLGLLLGVPSVYFNAMQLKILVQKQGIVISTGEIMHINLAVKFYTLFMPSTMVAGGIRWYQFSRKNGKFAEALAAIAFFRVIELYLTVVLGLAFWFLSGQDSVQVNVAWLVAIVVGTTLLWIAVTRASKPFSRWFEASFKPKISAPRWQLLLKQLERFFQAVVTYADFSVWDLFLVIFIGIIQQLIGIFSNMLLAKSVGIDLTYTQMGWIYSVVILAAQLPFAFAGGLGIREITLIALLSAFGIGADLALAFSLLLFVRGIFLSLVGGLLEVLQTMRIKRAT